MVLNPTTDDFSDQQPLGASGNILLLDPIESVRLRRMEARSTAQREMDPASLICIEADLAISKANNVKFDKWAIQQDGQIVLATNQIHKGRDEREAMRTAIEELTEQIKVLTSRLDQGETRIRSVESVCTFHAADLRSLLQEVQHQREECSSSTEALINPPEPALPGPVVPEPVHPRAVRRKGENPPLASSLVDVTPEEQRHLSPEG